MLRGDLVRRSIRQIAQNLKTNRRIELISQSMTFIASMLSSVGGSATCRNNQKKWAAPIGAARCVILAAAGEACSPLHVVAVEVHDLRPRGHEVGHELLLTVGTAVDLGEGTKFRVRSEHEDQSECRPLHAPRLAIAPFSNTSPACFQTVLMSSRFTKKSLVSVPTFAATSLRTTGVRAEHTQSADENRQPGRREGQQLRLVDEKRFLSAILCLPLRKLRKPSAVGSSGPKLAHVGLLLRRIGASGLERNRGVLTRAQHA